MAWLAPAAFMTFGPALLQAAGTAFGPALCRHRGRMGDGRRARALLAREQGSGDMDYGTSTHNSLLSLRCDTVQTRTVAFGFQVCASTRGKAFDIGGDAVSIRVVV